MQYKRMTQKCWLVKNSLKAVTFFFFVFYSSLLVAQEGVNVSGSNTIGSGGGVSYSVGHIAYQIHNGVNGSVVQGVQQPFEISIVHGFENILGINLFITAYPNPTTDYLSLEVENFKGSPLSYQLYDMSGKLLKSESITGMLTKITMSNLVPACYFVKVIQKNKELKAFKIIKK